MTRKEELEKTIKEGNAKLRLLREELKQIQNKEELERKKSVFELLAEKDENVFIICRMGDDLFLQFGKLTNLLGYIQFDGVMARYEFRYDDGVEYYHFDLIDYVHLLDINRSLEGGNATRVSFLKPNDDIVRFFKEYLERLLNCTL